MHPPPSSSPPPAPAPKGPTPPGPTLEESLAASARLSRTDLQSLQQWLSKQPHLPPVSDVELVPFLHCTNYSLERTKRLIDTFFTMRTAAPEVFADRDPLLPATQTQLTHFHLALMPERTPEGLLVACMGFTAGADLSSFDADRSTNACGALMEVVAMTHPTDKGFVCVLDARHFQLGHLARVSLRLLHVLLSFVQRALNLCMDGPHGDKQAVPVPMKAVHVINIHAVVEKTMMLVKPLLGRELQRLIHFHSGSMETFYKEIPREILPAEYGGTLESAEVYHKELVASLVQHREWVMSLAERTVDESLRPGNKERDVYGAAGSFKRLAID